VLVVLSVAATACSGGSEDTGSVTGSWDVAGIATGTGAIEPPVAGSTLTATITDTEINGSSGCNSYMGAARIDGSSVVFGPFAGTLMACADSAVMEQEQTYVTLLQSVDSWEEMPDGMNLKTDGTTVIRLVAADSSLAGSSWDVVAINNQKGGVQSIVPDSGPSLIFDEDLGVSGSTGCNNFFGTYSVDADTIAFRGIGATEAYCENTAEQEAWMLAALQNAATYTVNTQQLELFDESGSRLLTARR